MLRITPVQRDLSQHVLKLEGKLLGPWINELHVAYRESHSQAAAVVLDLAGVSFVDRPGVFALRDLMRRGVAIRSCSTLVAELLKENCA